jgi:hypothetical protein
MYVFIDNPTEGETIEFCERDLNTGRFKKTMNDEYKYSAVLA